MPPHTTPQPFLTLFRPIGQAEYDLLAEADWRAFPPRLPHQPIFYPVLTEAYAIEIARDWNTKDAASGFIGYVTRFRIDQAFASRYPVQTVGAGRHQELWVPAEDLPEFNRHIVGRIEVMATYRPASSSGFPGMLRFDVFGRLFGVEREGDSWKLYDLGSSHARRSVPNILVPAHLSEDQLADYLADLFHESARPERPSVRRL